MPLPQSVTKVITKKGKSELTFISNVDQVQYTIAELIRAANIDVGKYLQREIRKRFSQTEAFKSIRRGHAKQRYQYWARKQENDLQIGVENTKYGAESAWWADQAELGTNGQPKRGLIRSTVEDNIDAIREIQGQYLSAINDANEAKRLAEAAERAPDATPETDE